LWEIKSKYNLYLLEDAACSLGAQYDGKYAGNLADISVFSFHPRKFITTGEGGMVTTNHAAWFEWMEAYKHFGMGMHNSRLGTNFDGIGTNYKLSNVQAAIGLGQMRNIELLLEKRRHLAARYSEYLGDHPAISLPAVTPRGIHSRQSYCVFVPDRDQIIEKLKEKQIEAQIGTYALHMHKAFNQNLNCRIVGDMPGSRYAFEHCLTLPLYHDMKYEEQEFVVEQLLSVMTQI
jgi:dTDP-4-amino-4,6-dideoxygalactose transaminase